MSSSLRGISKWLGMGIAVFGAGCVLIFAGVVWFGNYMSEGVVGTATLQGNVLVALSNDTPVRQALLSGCHSTQGFPAPTSALLSSGSLAQIPSGTKMHMPSWGEDRQVGTMTISEGKLKGHQVYVCWGQFALCTPCPEASVDQRKPTYRAVIALGRTVLRNNRVFLLLTFVHIGVIAAQRSTKVPEFGDFASTLYAGRIAVPHFLKVPVGSEPFPDGDFRCIGADAEERRLFFSHAKVNFAGEWVVHACPCGMECRYVFMWNARTGVVHREFPMNPLWANTEDFAYARGFVHRADSRLLIIEGYTDEMSREGWRRYYDWDGRRFTLLRQQRLKSLSELRR